MALQVVGERGDRGITARGIGIERPGENRIDVAAQCGASATGRAGQGHARRRQRRFAARVGHATQTRRGRERTLPGQQFVEQHAERVDVGGDGHDAAFELFRRGIVGRGHATAQLGQVAGRLVVAEQLGDAEIEQAHVAGGGH
jgi:hypothetical protein